MKIKNFIEQVKDGDLVEWRYETLLGKIIRFFTQEQVSHTSSIRLEDGKAHNMEWFVNTDFVERDLRAQIRELRKTGKRFEVYWLKLKDEYEPYRKEIVQHLTSMSNLKYNTSTVLKLIFKDQKSTINNKVFCSQAVQAALIKTGLLSEDYKNGNVLVPGEFEDTGLYEAPIKIDIPT